MSIFNRLGVREVVFLVVGVSRHRRRLGGHDRQRFLFPFFSNNRKGVNTVVIQCKRRNRAGEENE